MLVYYSNNFTLFSNDTPAMPEIKEDEDAPAPPPVQKKAIPYASLQVIGDIHKLMQNSSNSSAPDFGDFEMPNKVFKESQTLKTLVYALGRDSIVLRISNLDDRFDGMQALVQQFDVNTWAREFYAEANYHLNASETIFKDLSINITEMNLGASVELDQLKNGTLNLTQWKTDPALDPVNVPKKPVDFVQEISLPKSALGQLTEIKEKSWLVSLEPQRIRAFKIDYITGRSKASGAAAISTDGTLTLATGE